MAMETMQDLLMDEVKDLYSAEKQIVQALPRMIKAAQTPDLAAALNEHLRVTQKQVQRLEQIAQQLGKGPNGKRCMGMEGLIEEGKEVLKEGSESELLDAAIIGAAQKVEHYEIAAYGTARAHAEHLGNQRVIALLEQTLEEEKQADENLTQLAESFINQMAANEGAMEMQRSSR